MIIELGTPTSRSTVYPIKYTTLTSEKLTPEKWISYAGFDGLGAT